MKRSMTFVAGAAAVVIAAVAGAQTSSTPRIDARQEKQEARIQKGIDSGKLNEKEAHRLEKGQARVQKMEDKAMSDGKMTKAERKAIEARQDLESTRIYTQKHDAQKAK